MMRIALAMTIAITACAIAGLEATAALPSGSDGLTSASATKQRCKHRAHHRKRCRKKVGGSNTTGPGDGAAIGAPVGVTGRLLATEREVSASQLQLQLSRPSVPAGSTIVEQYNAGQDPHNLVVEKGDGTVFAYPTLDPGGTQRQTLPLTHGTWTLYCSVLNHRELGMQATLTVD